MIRPCFRSLPYGSSFGKILLLFLILYSTPCFLGFKPPLFKWLYLTLVQSLKKYSKKEIPLKINVRYPIIDLIMNKKGVKMG